MSARGRKNHTTKWSAIQVLLPGEPPRKYEVDSKGRLYASDVPRNQRRNLADRPTPAPPTPNPQRPPSPILLPAMDFGPDFADPTLYGANEGYELLGHAMPDPFEMDLDFMTSGPNGECA
jgi:hypothetical protein